MLVIGTPMENGVAFVFPIQVRWIKGRQCLMLVLSWPVIFTFFLRYLPFTVCSPCWGYSNAQQGFSVKCFLVRQPTWEGVTSHLSISCEVEKGKKAQACRCGQVFSTQSPLRSLVMDWVCHRHVAFTLVTVPRRIRHKVSHFFPPFPLLSSIFPCALTVPGAQEHNRAPTRPIGDDSAPVHGHRRFHHGNVASFSS